MNGKEIRVWKKVLLTWLKVFPNIYVEGMRWKPGQDFNQSQVGTGGSFPAGIAAGGVKLTPSAELYLHSSISPLHGVELIKHKDSFTLHLPNTQILELPQYLPSLSVQRLIYG
jgi:hypothetical protein